MKISNQNLNEFFQNICQQINAETSNIPQSEEINSQQSSSGNVPQSQELNLKQSFEATKLELLMIECHLDVEVNPLKRKALDLVMGPEMMMFLGRKYLFNKDHEMATKMFLKAAKEGEEQAFEWLKAIKVPDDLRKSVADVFFQQGCIFEQKAKNFEQRKENRSKALEMFNIAVSLDHVEAIYQMASSYYSMGNEEQARLLYEKAASMGHEMACYDLGTFFENEGDFKAAAECYLKAPNVADALYSLAYFYLDDYEGIEPDFNKGLKFLIQAAQMECDDYELKEEIMSKFTKLNIPTEFSEEVVQLLFISAKDLDYDWSIPCLQKAADMGFPPALTTLGLCYEEGQDVQKNPSKAVEFYKQAAEKNFPEAQFHLGLCYQKGLGIESDNLTALDLLIKAATEGCKEALLSLKDIEIPPQFQPKVAELFFKCIFGSTKLEDEIAFEFLQKAVAFGHTKALCYLGIHYEKGMGTAPDKKKALECYNEALRQNVPAAYYYLGRFCRLYRHNEGDVEKALEYYLAAVLFRISKAADDLLWMEIPSKLKARVGEVLFNYAAHEKTCKYLSFECLKKASDLDHIKAMSLIGTYYEKGIGTSIDHAKAYHYYRQAAYKNDKEAIHHLGRCYQEGIGIHINQVLAAHYQKLAKQLAN